MNFFVWLRKYKPNSNLSKMHLDMLLKTAWAATLFQKEPPYAEWKSNHRQDFSLQHFFSFTKIELLPSVLRHKQGHLPSARIVRVTTCNRFDLQHQNKEDAVIPSHKRYAGMHILIACSPFFE